MIRVAHFCKGCSCFGYLHVHKMRSLPVLRCVCCTDGMYSEDGLSSGGEFYDENVEFRRPAPDVVIKSVPIVPSQQASERGCRVVPVIY